uniref:Probable proline--tRNA ligase, mitochondrial n=1 Tax=Anopheles atroparvus TaxID=41427 RepID=A0A182JII1_ANOAO
MHRVSKIFQPALIIPKNATVKNQDITSKSQKLMLEQGLIRQAGNGTFHVLPLLQRSVEKATNVIDLHMQSVGAQKLTLPMLTSADLWKKSGRLGGASGSNGPPTELLQTTDRHGKVQILGPTHEESITALLAAIAPVSYRQFPLRLYQISTKFRDEMKPRFGLMRAKEFLMKDLYTFDVDRDKCRQTYEEVNEAYHRMFSAVGVPFVKVSGDCGTMGGSLSHEYHLPSEVGEDELVHCTRCGTRSNAELVETLCQQCETCNGSSKAFERQAGIEVAHAFILEDRYTKALGATCLQPNGKPVPLQMGCYGIGVTRLIAAAVEVLSDEKEIRWPLLLAPYRVCIITPKAGSKEEAVATPWVERIYHSLQAVKGCQGDVVVDDRDQLTIVLSTMKLICETCTINRAVTGGKRVFLKTILAIGKGSEKKSDETKIMLITTANKTGTKYGAVKNISKIFTRFIDEGKATISFIVPEHDVQIKSDKTQLTAFLKVLKLVLTGGRLSDTAPAASSSELASQLRLPCLTINNQKASFLNSTNVLSTKCVIRNRKDYPQKGFSRLLVSLEISDIKLSRFDSQILLLQKLRTLNLSGNCLKTLPKSLGQLRLNELDVSSNDLWNADWGWLLEPNVQSSLQCLNISNNGLSCLPINVVYARSLVTLSAEANHIGKLPFAIWKMNRLRVLLLARNHIDGIPETIRRMRLEKLDLSDNRLGENESTVPDLRLANEATTHPSGLFELAARVVIDRKLPYALPGCVPFTVLETLHRTPLCGCGKPCFASKVYERAKPKVRT